MISLWSLFTGEIIAAPVTTAKPRLLPIPSAPDVMSALKDWKWGMSRENRRHMKFPPTMLLRPSEQAKCKFALTTKSIHRRRIAKAGPIKAKADNGSCYQCHTNASEMKTLVVPPKIGGEGEG